MVMGIHSHYALYFIAPSHPKKYIIRNLWLTQEPSLSHVVCAWWVDQDPHLARLISQLIGYVRLRSASLLHSPMRIHSRHSL